MKKLFLLLPVSFLFLFISSATVSKPESTGIRFFEGTWQDAIQKADKENKPVFLVLSTSWCGWCKKMRQNTYAQKKVGDYFNSRFINMELDGEHGDGQRLAQKFGVSAYPSVYLIDKNENPILSSEGYHEADDLIKLVKGVIKD